MADETERQKKIAELSRLREQAENAYDEMYEAHAFRDANVCYSDAKDNFYDAIALAEDLGLAEDAEYLRKRLEHVKEVFRSQFDS
jgi:hypothetical protein